MQTLSENARNVERFKKEIDQLSDEQRQTMDRATYVGMTPDEAQSFHARRKKLNQLIDELSRVAGSE